MPEFGMHISIRYGWNINILAILEYMDFIGAAEPNTCGKCRKMYGFAVAGL